MNTQLDLQRLRRSGYSVSKYIVLRKHRGLPDLNVVALYQTQCSPDRVWGNSKLYESVQHIKRKKS